jgi:hypothetical protein
MAGWFNLLLNSVMILPQHFALLPKLVNDLFVGMQRLSCSSPK